ncbi:MAG TPA: hypothetical protein VLI54_01680 [Bacillota bacterium]|nr:hypothetical protein [Bacillota bacterium]
MKFENKTGLGWVGLVGLGLGAVAASAGMWQLVEGAVDRPDKNDVQYTYRLDPNNAAYNAAEARANAELARGVNFVGYATLGGFCAFAADVFVAGHAFRRPEDTGRDVEDAVAIVPALPLSGTPGAV